MQMTFRWYGEGNDRIKLSDIKQIPGVDGIVWVLHHKMPGEVWEVDEIAEVKRQLDEYGGLKALKALSAPFPQIKFIPTGGVDRSNIDEFLAFDKIAAIGGSFFVKESLEKMEENK